MEAHGTDITDRQLAAMPYTTAIVKETLRQKAIVSSVWRKTLVEIELGGYRIPKARLGLHLSNTWVEACIWGSGFV